MWSDDAIFEPDGALHGAAHPSFRLSTLLPYHAGHPYTHTDAYERLFALFAPILQERCDRVLMWDRPGAKARRSKKIGATDWKPFEHIRSVYSDVEGGMFIGFNFVDARDKRGDGAGPCSFRFFVGRAIRLDVAVPLEDWNAGRVSARSLVEALQALPYFSFIAGYGLALAESFSNRGNGDVYGPLHSYALRYPAVDVVLDTDRSRSSADDETGMPELGLAGINWLTAVGSPFLREGTSGMFEELPPAITVDDGPNGIVFQLGQAPVSGQAGVDEPPLSLYHALGARLSRLWRPNLDMPRPPAFGDYRHRESLEWEQRFFGGAA